MDALGGVEQDAMELKASELFAFGIFHSVFANDDRRWIMGSTLFKPHLPSVPTLPHFAGCFCCNKSPFYFPPLSFCENISNQNPKSEGGKDGPALVHKQGPLHVSPLCPHPKQHVSRAPKSQGAS